MEIKPWLKHYDEGVPHTLEPYPEHTLLDVVSETARQKPDHPALLFKGTSLSYAKLEKLSDAFAAALAAKGVKKGDRVVLLLVNSPQSLIAQLGAWKAGAIVAPVNPLYTEPELEHALQECGAETIVVLTPFYEKIKTIQPRTNVRLIIATNIKEYLPPFMRILFTLFKEKKEGHRITLQSDDLWMKDMIRQYSNAHRPEVFISQDDPALLLFSGGTTGTPKAALGSHRALLISGMQIHSWLTGTLENWKDTVMLNMPLFHVYGNIGVLCPCLVGHNTMTLVPNPRDLDDLIKTIRKTRPSLLPGVPTLFAALLNHPEVQAGKVDFKSIKICISGAASLHTETKNRFESLTGGRLVRGYALTESMMAAVISPVREPSKADAVGLPLPDVEIRIADSDTGEGSLPPGEIGEILIAAPQLMMGYWERPTETDEILHDGWLYTGDIGYLDEDGYLFIVDRKKEVIKPSGFQVWPVEVEEVIASHPAVAEVGVAGVPDMYQGEAVKAWVVLCQGHEVTIDALRDHCRARLIGYKVPKHMEFRDSLPKTLVGKVLRRELAAKDATEQCEE